MRKLLFSICLLFLCNFVYADGFGGGDGKSDNIQTNKVYVPGGIGNCLEFDGTEEYVFTNFNPRTLIGNGNPFTISLWINPGSLSGTQSLVNATSVDRFYIQLSNQYLIWGLGGSFFVTSVSVTQDVWTHVVMTYDGSDLIFYKNGSNSYQTTLGSKDVPDTNLYFGAQTGSVNYFDGKIDNIQIYSIAQSTSWVTDDYNDDFGRYYTGSEESLIGLWRLDESTGDTADDGSLNSNNGTLYNMDNSNWVEGKVCLAGGEQTITVWESEDGVNPGEAGIQTFGDSNGRTVINGDSIYFSISGMEFVKLDVGGYLSPLDTSYNLGSATNYWNELHISTIIYHSLVDIDVDDAKDLIMNITSEGKMLDKESMGMAYVPEKKYKVKKLDTITQKVETEDVIEKAGTNLNHLITALIKVAQSQEATINELKISIDELVEKK